MRLSLPWVVLAVVLSTAACGRPEKAPAPPKATGPARPVTTAAVASAGSGQAGVPVSATVQARQRAVLSSRVPASVVDLPYNEGERVAAGAVVARLDDAALRAAVQAAEAADRAAEAERARMESLRSRDAATTREADEAVSRASAAHAALLAARDNLSYAALRAPFAGVVASRPAHVGDVATPGSTLIEIEGAGGHEVLATLDAAQAASLRVGATVSVLVDGIAEAQTARITALSPGADPTTHRFEARASLPAVPGLRSGLFARLLVPSEASEGRLLVPSSALFARGGLTGVFVVEHGRALLRWVAPGAASGDQTEIRAGLTAGERIAVDPATLEDGTPVAERPRS
jgi:membrane fusion protein, multidrug efflux system